MVILSETRLITSGSVIAIDAVFRGERDTIGPPFYIAIWHVWGFNGHECRYMRRGVKGYSPYMET